MRPTGVVAALPGEAAALVGARCSPGAVLELGARTLVAVAGIGHERARAAARTLVERGAVALVSWGVAGGLQPGLLPGSLLLPGLVLGAEGGRFETDGGWAARLAQAVGVGARGAPSRAPLLQARHVVRTSAEKRAAFEASGACAVDMESAAVAEAARADGLPFLAVRAVSDAAEDDLPPATLVAVDGQGRLRRRALAGSLARHPGQLGALWRMRTTWRAALASLRSVARAAGPDLCVDSGE